MVTTSLKTQPGSGEVLLYRADVPSLAPSIITRLNAKLSRDERGRAARFVFEKDRTVFIAAHALLRHALGLIFEESAIGFRTNAYGKPELDLAFEHDIHFNLSHTRGMAVCAISRGHAIGVDVEAIDRSVDVEMLAQQYFAASEHELVVEAPPEQRMEIFFRLWTLKEAMLKAVGTGLAVPPLREFAFTLEPLTLKLQPAWVEAGLEWQVWEDAPTAVHRLALAVRRSPAQPIDVAGHLIPLEQLI
jgi:4'-phosphopantetheinyl transferase